MPSAIQPRPRSSASNWPQQHQRLARCLEELDARHASAIRAAFLDGATYEDLAARMNVPLGTMKSWIRRGLLKLRACLER